MLDKNKSIIGVACGGYSSEKEISMKSGLNVFNILKNSGWKVFMLVIDKNEWYVKSFDIDKLKFSQNDFSFFFNEKKLKFDVIFNAVHGPPGENGELALMLESKNIFHTSCDFNSANLTYSKKDCLTKVKNYNVATAKSIFLNLNDQIIENKIIETVNLPCFVKANKAGSSFGVYRVTSIKKLKSSIKNAFNEDSQVIIESELNGIEVSVGVYRDKNVVKCLPVTEIISENEFFDYEAKYLGKSKEITPANIPREWTESVMKISIDLYKKLNLKGICRSEFIFVNNTPHLLEINSVPGLTEQSIIPKQCKAAGISLNNFFEILLTEAFNKN